MSLRNVLITLPQHCNLPVKKFISYKHRSEGFPNDPLQLIFTQL